MVNTSYLPKTATDGMEVLDAYGSIWRYDSQTNSWIYIGKLGDSPIVSGTKDGLVSPDIFTRISTISAEVQNGLNFDFLKIYPHLAGYYYLFQSSNHTITFKPESAHSLRIEVSRPRLLSLLSQLKCPGERGLAGVQGDSGVDGIPGAPETKYAATINNSRMLIDVPVDNSLGTPILLRVFAGNSTTATIIIKIIGSEFEIQQSQIIIDQALTFFDYSGGRLNGQITSAQWGSATWYYKALQMGRKGPTGGGGYEFLDITSDTINDAVLVSNMAVILLRQGDSIGSIYYLAAALFKTNCVSKLAISHLCSTTTISLTDSYAALQTTTDSCKSITRFSLQPVVAEIPNLIFSEWTPTNTCQRQRHFVSSRLSWPDFTQVGSSMVPWQQANNDTAADPGYPWSIIEESEPGQLCCQEDFFFCSNVNDVTGACPVNIVGGLLTPPTPAFGCDCDCPISFLLEGGYEFEDINITGITNISSQVAVCSINGGSHEYNITVNVDVPTRLPITISVIWKLEYDAICDDARALYSSQSNTIPGFAFDPRIAVSQANCPLSWSATDRSTQTPTLSLQHCDNHQTLTAIGTIPFYFIGSLGTINVNAVINTLLLNCCLGYRLTVSVAASLTTTAPTASCAELAEIVSLPSLSPSLSSWVSPSTNLSSLSPSLSSWVSPSLSPSPSQSLLSPSLSQSPSPSQSLLSPSLSPSPSQSLLSPSPSPSPSLSLSPSPSQSMSPSPSPSPSPADPEIPVISGIVTQYDTGTHLLTMTWNVLPSVPQDVVHGSVTTSCQYEILDYAGPGTGWFFLPVNGPYLAPIGLNFSSIFTLYAGTWQYRITAVCTWVDSSGGRIESSTFSKQFTI